MRIDGMTSGLTQIIQEKGPESKVGSFDAYLDQALELWDNTNSLEKQSDKMTTDFVLGKTDDISSVMLASQKANVALQFTVKVRDTMLEAFNEIMRMQV